MLRRVVCHAVYGTLYCSPELNLAHLANAATDHVNGTQLMMNDVAAGSSDVLVFIPSYNDMVGVAEVIAAVKKLSPAPRILLLDDGSIELGKDDWAAEGVLFFRLPDNYGLGTCTHIALDHFLNFDYRALVRIDADGQHPADQILDLVACLDQGEADLVVGCRTNQDGGGGPGSLVRRLVKWYFVRLTRLIGGAGTPSDVNTGFFALNRKTARVLNRFHLERYPEPQIFMLACREGLRLREVFVEQTARAQGRSSLNLLHATRLFYRFNILVIGEALRGGRR